jgi:hypothetical protein
MSKKKKKKEKVWIQTLIRLFTKKKESN